MHATTKKVKLDHVTIFTEKLKSMTVEVGSDDVLSKLSSGDVASNEIYYHKICYINFRTQYRDTLQKKLNHANEQIKEKESLIKAMRFSQVVNHIYDQKRYESVSSSEVAELEKTYLNLLKNDSIEQTSHVPRFCESLLESIPEVEKRTIKKTKFYIFFSDDIGDVVFEEYIKPDDYIKLVNRVVRPIRNIMKSVKNEFTGNIPQAASSNLFQQN